ncbi:uncharacterized protein LOC119089314 [Pollicipes pollicipes]|uniref:uncharacterized protein LOC119089314 n=1 Tax=Pollicipes pollicipes TaxID=41117 RepID=UPI001885852F|nr:uncharacterized protein LOC119089314 [Pollicipes pollicipes]
MWANGAQRPSAMPHTEQSSESDRSSLLGPSVASLSWSDPETTFDRLLKGAVYQKVVTRRSPVNDSSSADSEHAASIRLFESPSVAPPPPRGKPPPRRGSKANRTHAVGRAGASSRTGGAGAAGWAQH